MNGVNEKNTNGTLQGGGAFKYTLGLVPGNVFRNGLSISMLGLPKKENCWL